MCPTIIMAAPNGARKVKTDHPGIPVSIEETVAEAKSCFSAGASILHAHVRDDEGKHVLDTSLYRKLLNALSIEVPNMLVQVTTESVGIYSPEEQASLVYELKPDFISVGFREMIGDNSIGARRHAQDFYHQAHFVFGYVDKKAFFDWKCSDLEAVQAPNDHSSRTEFDRLKNQKKRSRMVEGLKEKWYSFLLMDAMRFITEGEAFGFPQEFRTTTLNSKYFNGISSFNVPYDGAKPFFRQDSTVFVAPLKYASYNEAN